MKKITLLLSFCCSFLGHSQDSVNVYITTPPIYTFNQGQIFAKAVNLPYDPIYSNISVIMNSIQYETIKINHYIDDNSFKITGSFNLSNDPNFNNLIYSSTDVILFQNMSNFGSMSNGADFISDSVIMANNSLSNLSLGELYSLRNSNNEICLLTSYLNSAQTGNLYYYFKIEFTDYQSSGNYWNYNDSIPVKIGNDIIGGAKNYYYNPTYDNLGAVFNANLPVISVTKNPNGTYDLNGITYQGSDELKVDQVLNATGGGDFGGDYYMSDSLHTTLPCNSQLDSIYNARTDGDSIFICFFYDNIFSIVSFYYIGFVFELPPIVPPSIDSSGFVSGTNTAVTEFKLAQNPSQNVANVYTNQKTIYIYNDKGTVIKSINTGNSDEENYYLIPIDISDLDNGIYLINDGKKTLRLVKLE